MSSDTYFRIVVAIFGLLLGGLLAASLVTGRVRWSHRTVTRAADKASYWKAVGINTAFVLSFAIAICLPAGLISMGLIFGLMVGQFLQLLASGEVQRFGGRVWSRARGDPGYWIWVAIYSSFIALFVVFWGLALAGIVS